MFELQKNTDTLIIEIVFMIIFRFYLNIYLLYIMNNNLHETDM